MVGVPQYGVARDYRFKGVDGLGTFRCPYEGYVLLGKLLDWSHYVHVPLDERAIVSEQPQCAPDVMHVIQHFLPCS